MVNRGALFEFHTIIEVVFDKTSAPHHGECDLKIGKISFVNDLLSLRAVVTISYSLVRHPLTLPETKAFKALRLTAAAGTIDSPELRLDDSGVAGIM